MIKIKDHLIKTIKAQLANEEKEAKGEIEKNGRTLIPTACTSLSRQLNTKISL